MNAHISFSELLDKITILMLKAARVKHPQARANAMQELYMLMASESYPITSGREYFWGSNWKAFSELYDVNARLWNLENLIRVAVKEKRPQEAFELIQEIHALNAKRSEIKKSIMDLEPQEVKDYT